MLGPDRILQPGRVALGCLPGPELVALGGSQAFDEREDRCGGASIALGRPDACLGPGRTPEHVHQLLSRRSSAGSPELAPVSSRTL